MKKHYVKSWAHFFDAIKDGKKLHDLRKLDRDYNVGDILVLQRYDNINGNYTGEEIEVEITYITSNKVPCAFSSSALDRDYGIFSLRLLTNCIVTDDRPELFVPHKNGGSFLIGESVNERQTRIVSSVTPNPNAEYYQNS